MEGIRRSKLVFAGGHEGPEAVPIKDLKRVREPVSRSKSGAQVKVADALHGRSRHGGEGYDCITLKYSGQRLF